MTGMTKHEATQARRIASIPRHTFEELVESDDPPSPEELEQYALDVARMYRSRKPPSDLRDILCRFERMEKRRRKGQ